MEQNVQTKLDTHALGRLFFLGVFSLFLASFFPLLAPFPIVLSFLFSGRVAGWAVSVASLLFLIAISLITHFPVVLAATYVLVIGFSFVISEIFFRNIEPMKGITYAGWITIGVIALFLIAIFLLSDGTFLANLKSEFIRAIEEFRNQNSSVLESAGRDAESLQTWLANPELAIKEILYWSPAAIFVTIFISIWASVLMILRNSIIWKKYRTYAYTGHNVLRYRTPEYLVYLLIIALVVMIGGEYLFGKSAYYIGGNLLYGLSVFYFFQGFGIYLELLAWARIRGILRTLLMTFTIIVAWKLLVLIGIFDLWFDFRKMLRKKSKNEGDIL